ncbi:CocE/NonD family hydrolase [Cohnella endophytica]|uniref:CocE/NonD family hydrolase n=1 Tax=Cohnella endophytica TaxID=2419778 RepID=A0A494XZM9_9BACL|nr:CocE/NonD family hydrolase [Cohnella endophytica]RKP53003.1 CocE/NonD family hydrolase [Cohnella endophytica]
MNEPGEINVSGFMVEMRDGVRLKTHVWLPRGEGPWSVVFLRNPYVDGGEIHDPDLMKLVHNGYAVVCQECRGRGASEGEWEPFVNERSDGLDTLNWILGQPWQDGNIGLYGGSYLSFNQWVLADELPPEVKTLYISVLGTDQNGFIYMNGMFRHDIYTNWATSNAGVDWGGRDPAEVAAEAYRYRPQVEMDEKLLGKRLDWYRDFLANPGSGDPLWQEGLWEELHSIPSKVNVPVCMAAGWFDIALDAMFRSFAQLRPEIRERSRLVVGPWVHSLIPYGDLAFPNGEVEGPNGGTRAVLEWFDYTLKGKPYPDKLGVVHAYTIGSGQWTTWSEWPPRHETVSCFLNAEGGLDPTREKREWSISFPYDPADPVETAGGSGLLSVYGDSPYLPKAASVLQPEPGYRADVVTFLSEPLARNLSIAGRISVVLFVSSTAEDTAFTVKISEVHPSGEAYNIADGITSLAYRNGSSTAIAYEPGKIERIDIELWPIAWRLGSGSRIRLDVSSSNFPAYHVHPNLAGNWAEQGEIRTAVQTLYWGDRYEASVELPVVAKASNLVDS